MPCRYGLYNHQRLLVFVSGLSIITCGLDFSKGLDLQQLISTHFRKVKMAGEKLLSTKEVSKHKTPDDCWIVVDNKVWDVTDFVEEHPGGSTSKICRLCWALNSKKLTFFSHSEIRRA